MVGAGVEILIGGKIDPLFGPVVVVGFGGILVELLRDVSTALAPVARSEARGMLSRLKGASLLDGFRGSEAVDIDALSDVVCRISELISDQRGAISEVDVNPLICAGRKTIAVDALITRLRPPPAAEHTTTTTTGEGALA